MTLTAPAVLILYSLFWKRFNTAGAVSAIYGGLISALLLVIFSPVVSGTERALLPDVDFAWFPLSNPGIISIPVGFLCGSLGTALRKECRAAEFAETEVRSLTGVGAGMAAKDSSPGRPRGRAVSARPRSSSAHRFRPQPRR